MRRRRQLFKLLAATTFVLGGIGTVLWFVAKHEPTFYQRAQLDAGPDRQKLAQDFFRNFLEVCNDVANNRPWAWTFSQSQMNAYLQDENGNGTGLFSYPDSVSDPRVEFADDRIRIGFRYGTGTLSTIVAVDLRTWLVAKEPNAVALELCGLSVGGFPLGSHAMMEYVTEAARGQNADVTWYRHGAHPVAIVRLQANQNRPTVQISRFEISADSAKVHGKPTAEVIPPTDATGN